MAQLDIVDLDALVQPVGRIKVFGRTHDVMPIDGNAYDLLVTLTAQEKSGETEQRARSIDVAREIVKQCVPNLPDDQRMRLSIQQLTRIIEVAAKQVDRVSIVVAEGPEGNAGSPAGAASLKPGGRKKLR